MQFNPPELVTSILKQRYFQKDENWDLLCRRVAKAAASVEKEETQKDWEEKFYLLMREGKGLLNTPALVNLGTNHTGCAAACFSFRPQDSMASILEIGRLAAMTLKFGGGVGFELSFLRPEGSPVQSTHKQSMGPCGVMKYYNSIGDMITQGGIRKAALIAILRIDHPDIIKFCRAKNQDGLLANFNISVSVTDGFMKKLINAPNKPHVCRFGGKQYHVLPTGKAILRGDRGSQKVLSVADVYDVICKGGSVNGDPGVFFVDNVNRDNPLINGLNDIENKFYMAGANPCLAGDQKVYVADGREFVSIKTLAEEDKDVQVFCLDENQNVVVKTMRSPRLTGKNKKLLRIRLTDTAEIKCTPNHKIQLRDGFYVEAKDLKIGAELAHLRRVAEYNGPHRYWSIYSNKSRSKSVEHRLVAQNNSSLLLDKNLSVHHLDGNTLNNFPSNLKILPVGEHTKIHSHDLTGSNNPRFINVETEIIFKETVKACSQAGRVLSRREFIDYSKQNGLPIASKYRLVKLGFKSIEELLDFAAEEAHVFSDKSKLKSYRRFLNLKQTSDLDVIFDENEGILVNKICEHCSENFITKWITRGQSYCSNDCASKSRKGQQSETQTKYYEDKQIKIRDSQIEVYLSLKEKLGRDPIYKEWAEKCTVFGIPKRLRSTSKCNRYCFRTFSELKEASENSGNFKVTSIEEIESEDVYNGTVEKHHNILTFASARTTKNGILVHDIVSSMNCSELPLSDREACVLGSLDLGKYIVDGKVDKENLSEDFGLMTRFLDNVIDVTNWPDQSIEEKVKLTRRVGVGVMGFASALDKLGIRYGSEECLKVIDILGTIRTSSCDKMSMQLAKERFVYPAGEGRDKYRNVSRTTIPPTGTLAMIADTSWSIEPHFYWVFEENRNNETRIRYSPGVLNYISQDTLDDLVDTVNGDLKHLNNLIQAQLPKSMVLAKDVSVEEHLSVMAAWQKHTSSSISKTIVAPPEILTEERVKEIYKFAWENKIKGLTVYPEGSRKGEPMSLGKRKAKRKSLPQSLKSDRHEFEVLLGDAMRKTFCFVGLNPEDESQPVEVFLKHPYVQDPMAIQFIDLTTRLLSLALRYRFCDECGQEVVPLGKIIKQLRETDGQSMFSVPGIFVKALGKYLEKDESVGKCPNPNCNGDITIIEGCEYCLTCGHQACS